MFGLVLIQCVVVVSLHYSREVMSSSREDIVVLMYHCLLAGVEGHSS